MQYEGRFLSVDALACPRCSTREQTVPMTVLAFLTDPDVVGRILRHLGLSTSAPALAPAGSPQPELGFALAEESGASGRDQGAGGGGPVGTEPLVRPPP